MNNRGNSFANGISGQSGNSMNNGLSASGSDPNWQRRLYGWLADTNCWTFMEPGF